MRKIQKWVPLAISVLEETDIANDKELTIESAYKGYFASFGAVIVQSGLFPAVVFFESEITGAKADRAKVPTAILRLLQKQYANNEELAQSKKLSDYLLRDDIDPHKQSRQIQTAIVCLKLAARSFNSIETKNN